MTKSTLTKPRREALTVAAAFHPELVRISNVNDLERGTTYHQTARWLISEGYASPADILADPAYCTTMVLTEAGLALAREHGVRVGRDG